MTDHTWLDDFCSKLKGSKLDYKIEWQAQRYLLGDKMFGMRGDHPNGRPIATFKLSPSDRDMLRMEFEDIIPGYYMNKIHWNTVYLDGKVPKEVIKSMAEKSYHLILTSLSKKKQAELLGK